MRRYPGNHTDSELLTVPRFLKTRPGAPQTHLAYITDSEANLLQEHKPGTPHEGAAGIPNYDSWDIDESGRGSFTSGAEASARENPQDRSQQRQDYSHSTRDVRSSADDREKFRIKTGQVQYVDDKRMISQDHYVETPAEQMAVLMSQRTKNPKYMNMPIFVPKGVSYEEQLALVELGKNDPQKFIDTITKFEDITAGNPNLDFQQGFGTGYQEWYQPKPLQGGDGGVGWGSGYGSYGSGGRSDYGGGSIGPAGGPIPPGNQGERWGAQTPWQQIMINTHAGKGFRQGYARGGIVSLVE